MKIKSEYEVIVGNIGTVCNVSSKQAADGVYAVYKEQSIKGYGRASGEPVTMTKNEEIIKEWVPIVKNDKTE